jgi:hypothetical protein
LTLASVTVDGELVLVVVVVLAVVVVPVLAASV